MAKHRAQIEIATNEAVIQENKQNIIEKKEALKEKNKKKKGKKGAKEVDDEDEKEVKSEKSGK
jgi:hypothetical protein